MDIVPVLHIQDGRPVQGGPGAWIPMDPPYPDGGDDLRGFVRHLYVRFGDVLLVDLGSGPNQEPDHTFIQRLAKQHVELWVDAFPESLEDIMDLLVSGAARLTVRMDTVDPKDLEEVLAIAEGEIWLGYSYSSDSELVGLLKKMKPHRFLDQGAKGVVLVALAPAGRASGADPSGLRHLRALDAPVWYAGGVASEDDLDELEEAGAAGVFVGQALLQDLDRWARIAKSRGKTEPEEEEAEEEVDEGAPSSVDVSMGGGRSFLPGVLPSRPRIETDPDEKKEGR
ncbi:MAG: hypothetical protein KY455_12545 [Euryarchaeota archaeon]|nr:hypothetical protein [Euryarchaeota archaeon]